jgi:hypothetical protein
MKRKALLCAIALVGASLLWSGTASATPPSVIFDTPTCGSSAIGYHIDNGTDDNFTHDYILTDGSDFAGSKADDPVHVTSANSPYTDYYLVPSAITEVQSAKPYTLTLYEDDNQDGVLDGGDDFVDDTTFDYRTCFTYGVEDDFNADESSKSAEIGNHHIGTATGTEQASRVRLSRYLVPPGLTSASTCGAYLDRTNSGSGFFVDCVVYADSGGGAGPTGSPLAQVALNGGTQIAQNTPAWYTGSISLSGLTPGSYVWIGIYSAKQIVQYFDDNSANPAGGRQATASAYPTTLGAYSGLSSPGNETRRASMYLSGGTASGDFVSNGNDVGDRVSGTGGAWAGSSRGEQTSHMWTINDSIGTNEGGLAYVQQHSDIGFLTRDSGLSTDYEVSTLIDTSDTAHNMAPGVTVNFVDSTLNVFFKIEDTTTNFPTNTQGHVTGSLIGGITTPSYQGVTIHSGLNDACQQDDTGFTAGEEYWLNAGHGQPGHLRLHAPIGAPGCLHDQPGRSRDR